MKKTILFILFLIFPINICYAMNSQNARVELLINSINEEIQHIYVIKLSEEVDIYDVFRDNHDNINKSLDFGNKGEIIKELEPFQENYDFIKIDDYDSRKYYIFSESTYEYVLDDQVILSRSHVLKSQDDLFICSEIIDNPEKELYVKDNIHRIRLFQRVKITTYKKNIDSELPISDIKWHTLYVRFDEKSNNSTENLDKIIVRLEKNNKTYKDFIIRDIKFSDWYEGGHNNYKGLYKDGIYTYIDKQYGHELDDLIHVMFTPLLFNLFNIFGIIIAVLLSSFLKTFIIIMNNYKNRNKFLLLNIICDFILYTIVYYGIANIFRYNYPIKILSTCIILTIIYFIIRNILKRIYKELVYLNNVITTTIITGITSFIIIYFCFKFLSVIIT